MFSLAFSKYRIASVERASPSVRILRLEPLSGTVPAYLPGQFMFLHILDDKGGSVLRRPYSVASSPSSPYLEFAIEMVGGQMTSRLENMKAGDVLGVEGPSGSMAFKGEAKAAFVAGGTGITPIISILRHISEKRMAGSYVFFYSARARDHILYNDELQSLCKRNPSIRVVITLTREVPEGWKGECGRINDALIAKHLQKPSDYDWWICGPAEMVKAIRVCLTGLGVEPKRMRIEGWG